MSYRQISEVVKIFPDRASGPRRAQMQVAATTRCLPIGAEPRRRRWVRIGADATGVGYFHNLSLVAAILVSLGATLTLSSTASALTLAEIQAEPDRLIGFGASTGFGYGGGATMNLLPGEQAGASHFDIELPGFELRVFPVDDISIDSLWRIGNMVYYYQQTTVNDTNIPFYLQNIYCHFHGDRHAFGPGAKLAFSAGPGVVIGASSWSDGDDTTYWGMFGLSGRFGADFLSNNKMFGYGIFLRPSLFFSSSPQGTRPYLGSDLLVEFTWTFYLLKPKDD